MLRELGRGAVVIGGFATRIWLIARPIAIPARATADVDLGIDRHELRLYSDRPRVRPLLEERGFENAPSDETLRFTKVVGARKERFVVDLLAAKGQSRKHPPVIEPGLSSVAAPGLAYALGRRPVAAEVVFGQDESGVAVQLVRLDGAFVMKAALCSEGLRQRPDRRRSDTIDAILLAAACLEDDEATAALARNRNKSEVRAALRWLDQRFRTPRTKEARRVEAYLDELGRPDGGAWAAERAARLVAACRSARG
ncbi:MAG TPA: hypothetical protein VF715_12905 [Thermoleophilaceae bacterium]